ncbi:MAG: hypothetical protein R6V78_07995 [Desulfosarcina sp.]
MGWVALGLTVETAVFTLAGVVWFMSMGYTLAEAGAGAVVTVFMAISLVHQLSLFTGSPLPAFILETTALAAIFLLGLRRLPRLFRTLESAAGVMRRERLAGLTIATAWTVMASLVGLGWLSADRFPAAHPWNALVGTWANGGILQLVGSDPILPLNATALFYHTARFGLEPNACGFGLLANMAVGLSTYALARRYSWPPMALTVSLMVLSMPRLVHLAMQPSGELVSTLAIVYSLVLVYRLLEQHRTADLRFFILCILFCIHAHPMSIALAPVMAILLLVVMIRRHGWLLWRELIAEKPFLTALILLPALIFSQIPVFTLNLAHGHPLFGAAIAFDNDGILGAAANLIRYLFISVDPTQPVQQMLVWLVGLDLKRLLLGVYSAVVAPVFGLAGVHGAFLPVFSGSGRMGFGPLAPLLVLSAMTYALLHGPRRLKAVGVAWMGYLYLAALVVAWDPDSLSDLSPLYAANGFIVAFYLPPWRLRRRGMRLLQTAFALLLFWAIAYGAFLRV